MAVANYVKFLRGTIEAYNNLSHKDDDTLYFVSQEPDSDYGYLYLGTKAIGANQKINITDIKDIILQEPINTNNLLIYDKTNNAWINKPFEDILTELINSFVMQGASDNTNGTSGFAPAPSVQDKNLYLQGDGTWSDPTRFLTPVVNEIISNVSGNTVNLHKVEGDILNLQLDTNSLMEQISLNNRNINQVSQRLIWQPIPIE